MERALHHVADLPDAARSEVERLMGHPLKNDDVLYIASIGVQDDEQAAERTGAWGEAESLIQQTQNTAAKSGLSPEQIDALIDAECNAVRYGTDK
jgi:hypothetical protein